MFTKEKTMTSVRNFSDSENDIASVSNTIRQFRLLEMFSRSIVTRTSNGGWFRLEVFTRTIYY